MPRSCERLPIDGSLNQLFPPRRTPILNRKWFIWIALVTLTAASGTADAQTDEEMAMMEAELSGSTEPAAPAPIPLTPTESSPVVLWQMVRPDFSSVLDQLRGLSEPSTLPDTPISTGPKLRNEAHVAFRYGNLPLARELFFGHLALGEESAAADLQSIQFSQYYRRPAWHLRWGLAIGVTGDTEASGFDPITAGTGNGAGGGVGPGGMEPGAMEMAMETEGMEESSMPELASEETAMMEMEMEMAMEMGGLDEGMGRTRPSTPAVAIPEASIADESIDARLTELTGLVGETLAEGMSKRVAEGAFGAALTDVAEEAPNQGYTVGGDSVSPSEMRMWVPGVVYIGEGSSREMTELAAKENIELLLYVVVSLKVSRLEEVQNITRAKIIDCKSGKTLVASGAMDNRDVKRLVAANRGTPETHVSEQLETFWEIIDSRLKLSPFPNLTPDISRRRVSQLIADPKLTELRKMAEVRLFHQKGWLTDQELELAFEIIAGSDGTKILHGPKSESIPIIRQMVNNSLIERNE